MTRTERARSLLFPDKIPGINSYREGKESLKTQNNNNEKQKREKTREALLIGRGIGARKESDKNKNMQPITNDAVSTDFPDLLSARVTLSFLFPGRRRLGAPRVA